jgi:hypothetical protein
VNNHHCDDDAQRLDEVIAEYLEAVDAGLCPDPDEWLARFPDLAAPLARFFADQGQVHGLLGPLRQTAAFLQVKGPQGQHRREQHVST